MKRQLVATCALALLVLASAPTWAANGNIGLFFDESASLCTDSIPDGGFGVLYVYALLEGASQFGITGVEYKIQVGPNSLADPGWVFGENFDPALVMVGTGALTPVDPGVRGINAAWPSCQVGDGYKKLIETVFIQNMGAAGGELILRVTKRDVPSDQFFQCPLFVLCDAPVYTKLCIGNNIVTCQNPNPPFGLNAKCSTSGEAFINSTRNCTVAVAPTNWSTVKELYRGN